MPVSTRLLQKLHEWLGPEATNDLLAWMDEAARVERVRAELSQLRLEMAKEFGKVQVEMAKGFAKIQVDMARRDV